MCTHGSGGLRDWLFGSIAQQVIAQGSTSVLLVPPSESDAPPVFACRLVLVPLDGDPAHEQGISVAIDFARLCAAAVHLLMVVPTPSTLSGERAATGRMLPGATAALLKLEEQSAAEYLHDQLTKLQSTNLTITAEVARGDPAKTIVSTAQQIHCDLIVLGTHGKVGMDAFWQGSVAPKVSSQALVPMLLVRLRDEEHTPVFG